MVAMRPLLFATFLCVVSSASSVSAQVPPPNTPLPGERDLIRDRQERLLEEQRRRLEELQQLPGRDATEVEPIPEDQRCFDIHTIILKGASLISAQEQAVLVQPFQDKCLGANQLNALLKAITQFYIDRGYVTSRAYLPQQDMADGELEVLVVEGRLEGLDQSAVASDRELAMAFPGQTGKVVDLRELEQLVDQLNRLPSRPAQLELLPGEQVGGSRVSLKGNPLKPWRVNLNRHNNGESSTGEQQWGAGLDWDSPLGLADQLRLYGGGDAVSDKYRHSANQGLFYSLPYGWWTFSYSYNQSYYRTQGETSGFLFEMDGESKSHQLSAERVLHRNAVSKTAISFGVSHLLTRNYIENSLLDVSSHRLSETQLGLNHGRRIGTAFVNADLGWQHGTGSFDAQRRGDPQYGEPDARYHKYSLTLSALQPFQLWGESFSFDSLLNAQKSEDVLYSPQRISIGGLASVRGFKEQSLSGDTGGYWRNQLRWRRPISWEPLRPFLQEYGLAYAYDVGVIHGGRYNPDLHGRLSGHGLELSARGAHVATSITLARSLERPGAITEREHPVYFRVDLFF
ncbi:ShlB/FhaC/HecB family hemolysin secretion/activation protein [Pseudomonas stutzeri]|uniref:ShlB/FhaC/HecB family hemolysin secretion/activation protein n=1 Tax=Stutzerimonas stutzeri TaxID=316 RepID=UPI00210E8046|nr:ShlB/FhaC/HecB family hemolysin secretion/activation protein [Stutzerimonas stutzeri]MCQ4312324.1 ShlB/FhaC/HecB family hemolysin secretion/activation protein [Stutzerimonas stutzeri]